MYMEHLRQETLLPPIRYFSNMMPSVYEHPQDHAALDALRKIPGLDKVFKAVSSSGFEPIQYSLNIANNVRVTPSQEKSIYRILRHAVQSLNITEPELYITNDRNLNAFTSGVSKPWIVLNSGIVENLTDSELLWVLSHELGHILSGHVLYHSTAQYLLSFGSSQLAKIPVIGELLGGIVTDALLLSMLKWYRMSEFTADRVAHLVVGDTAIGVSVLYKLSGGYSTGVTTNLEAFLSQADDFNAIDSTLAGKATLLFSGALLQSHPFAVVRARAIAEWGESDEYDSILDRHMTENCVSCKTTKCPSCGGIVRDGDLYCYSCGNRLKATYFSMNTLVHQEDNVEGKGDSIANSTLSGGLGKRANEILEEDEKIIYEMEIHTGIGIVMTQQNLYIIRGGLLAAGDFNKVIDTKYVNADSTYYIYKVGSKYFLIINDPPSHLELKALSELAIGKLRTLKQNVIPIQSSNIARRLAAKMQIDIINSA